MILMDMFENGLRVIRVYMEEMELGRGMWKESCYNFVMKRSCVWQTHGSEKGRESDVPCRGKWDRDWLCN